MAPSAGETKNRAIDASTFDQLLPRYYKNVFPFELFFKWLSYGRPAADYIAKREFSFTLKDDIFIRYLSFSDQIEMEKEMQRKNPLKIDIGAVFSHRPKDYESTAAGTFQPKEKELVFDIDITDYDDVRICCKGADICPKCWDLVSIAVQILNRALRNDFGYKHLLWVYSGRRGVHCWVADARARKSSGQVRTAVAEYLSVVKGGKRPQLSKSIHTSIVHAMAIIDSTFPAFIEKQDYLSDENLPKFLEFIPDKAVREHIPKHFKSKGLTGFQSRWEATKVFLKNCVDDFNTYGYQETLLQMCYPRIDINVSTGVNHLLKAPFCIHPKTGRVCVPFNPEQGVDPFSVPTIVQIFDEVDSYEKDSIKERTTLFKKITCMAKYKRVFEVFVAGLAKSVVATKREESDKTLVF